MPFNGEKQCVGEDQPSDSDSSRFSESMASLSDYECSRQSFTSDSSSKSSSPALLYEHLSV
uniref:T-complex 11 like 2 n=1 Tax=Saimiri boliviensis boliviensis TaxID=39432 RepID=A0A2K6TET0_SAIBB